MKLKQKSEFNLYAAEVLIKNNLYAPSVHCSYYACFQLMKNITSHKLGISYEMIDDFLKKKHLSLDERVKRTNEHGYIKQQILNDIVKKYSVKSDEYKDFNREFKDLQTYRIQSDYKDEEILSTEADKALRISVNLVGILKSVFK